MKYCSNCGKKLNKSKPFCANCGAKVEAETTPDPVDETQNIEGSSLKKSSSKGIVKAAVIIVCFLVLAVALFFVFKKLNTKTFSEDLDAIELASNSVVMLDCYDKSANLIATGSGFFMFEDGVIVTNYHVIAEDVYSVFAVTEQGKQLAVQYVLASDEELDVAILKCRTAPEAGLLSAGSSDDLQKGQPVVAIGSPLGLINTVSNGVFSGYVDDEYCQLLQFSAPISSGSSGGALFNDSGEVIGITCASFIDGQNINLAIPIELVCDMWEGYRQGSEVTLAEFYDEHVHTFDVTEVFEQYEDYIGIEISVAGYISVIDIGSHEDYSIVLIVPDENDILGEVNNDKYPSYRAMFQMLDDTGLRAYFPGILDYDGKFSPGDYVKIDGEIDISYSPNGTPNVLFDATNISLYED